MTSKRARVNDVSNGVDGKHTSPPQKVVSLSFEAIHTMGVKCDVGRGLSVPADDTVITGCKYASAYFLLKEMKKCTTVYTCGKRRHICDLDSAFIVGYCCYCFGEVRNLNGPRTLKSTVRTFFPDVSAGAAELEPTLHICEACALSLKITLGDVKSESVLTGKLKWHTDSEQAVSAKAKKSTFVKEFKTKLAELEQKHNYTVNPIELTILGCVPSDRLLSTLDSIMSKCKKGHASPFLKLAAQLLTQQQQKPAA